MFIFKMCLMCTFTLRGVARIPKSLWLAYMHMVVDDGSHLSEYYQLNLMNDRVSCLSLSLIYPRADVGP